MALWTPGPWDLVADPVVANAMKVNALVNGKVPAPEEAPAAGCPMPKAPRKAKTAPAEDLSSQAE